MKSGGWLPLAGVVLVLGVSAWLRFQRIDVEPALSDEITYTGRAVALRDGRGVAASDHPPLFWILTAGVMKAVPDPVHAGRLVSAAAGVLGVLATILLFRAAGGWPAGLVAGAALGVLSFHVHWSRLAELDVLFLAFVVLAYVVYLRARSSDSLLPWLGAGLLAGVAASAKFPGGGALAVIGLHIMLSARSVREWFRLRHVLVAAGFLVAFAPTVAVMAAAGKSGLAFHTADRYAAGDVDTMAFSIVRSPARAALDLVKVCAGFFSTDAAALKAALSAAVVVAAVFVAWKGVARVRQSAPLALVVIHCAFYFAFFTVFPVKFDYYHLTEAALLVPAAAALTLEGVRASARAVPGPKVRPAATAVLVVATTALLGFNAWRSTGWPRDGPGAIALANVFRFLASQDGSVTKCVAMDGGYYAVFLDVKSRGRLDPKTDAMIVVSQNVNLKVGGPDRVMRELREKGATALVCTNKKLDQEGWGRLEDLMRAETRPWRRATDPALPERLPVFVTSPR